MISVWQIRNWFSLLASVHFPVTTHLLLCATPLLVALQWWAFLQYCSTIHTGYTQTTCTASHSHCNTAWFPPTFLNPGGPCWNTRVYTSGNLVVDRVSHVDRKSIGNSNMAASSHIVRSELVRITLKACVCLCVGLPCLYFSLEKLNSQWYFVVTFSYIDTTISCLKVIYTYSKALPHVYTSPPLPTHMSYSAC